MKFKNEAFTLSPDKSDEFFNRHEYTADKALSRIEKLKNQEKVDCNQNTSKTIFSYLEEIDIQVGKLRKNNLDDEQASACSEIMDCVRGICELLGENYCEWGLIDKIKENSND